MKTAKMGFLILWMVFLSFNSMAAETAYPTRPIEMTIGFAPGAGTDLGARMIAEHSKKILGVDVVCVNKPGGAGRVAMTLTSKGKPDGYSLGATTSSCIVASPHLEPVIYKFEDFTYINQYGTLNFGVSVVQGSPFKTFKEVIEFARANPDKLTVGIVGVGTTDHIALQAFALFENLKIKFVPFDGAAPTLTALLGGHVMIASTASSGYAPHVKGGTLRLLVTYGEERMEQSPDVPTLKELGYPSLVIQSWYVIYGPKNMETSIVKKLEDAFGKAMMTPEFKKVADHLEIYTKKPLFGQELTKALSKHYKDNAELYRKLGLIK
ncbi:MAG: tripartite tricarboxylate transporter substrate binding protein [Thermodesulfobacteriota bacterium]|nr:tripartite tricarboxylate transporter substrate binding protein [Thermodesulfobacteriota bacterium]